MKVPRHRLGSVRQKCADASKAPNLLPRAPARRLGSAPLGQATLVRVAPLKDLACEHLRHASHPSGNFGLTVGPFLERPK